LSEPVYYSKLVFTYFKCLYFSHSSAREFGRGMQSSSCPGNHQTNLHGPGCYDYWSDL